MSEERSYNWYLIEFNESSSEEGIPYVDCVPATWINYNPVNKLLLTYYPPPPYDNEVLSDLKNKVRNKESPAKEWPLWHISIRGGAGKKKLF